MTFHKTAIAALCAAFLAAPAQAQSALDRLSDGAAAFWRDSGAAELSAEALDSVTGAADDALGWSAEQLEWAAEASLDALADARRSSADAVVELIDDNRTFLKDAARLGFEVEALIIDVALLPQVSVRFIDRGPTGETDAVLEEYADRPLRRIALQSMLTARELDVAGFGASGVWLQLGLPPRARVVLRPKDAE